MVADDERRYHQTTADSSPFPPGQRRLLNTVLQQQLARSPCRSSSDISGGPYPIV